MSATRVVLIEDDLESQFLVTEVLVSAFKSVDIALGIAATVASLHEARNALRALGAPTVPTVVLVDLHLTDSQGVDTWDYLTGQFPELSMIAYSADSHALGVIAKRGGLTLDKSNTHQLPGMILDLTRQQEAQLGSDSAGLL